MSWDVVIFNLNKKVSSVEEINEDVLIPIASNSDFRKLITENFPDVKWDGNCGIIERVNIYIELFIGDAEEDTFSNTIFFLRDSEASIFPVITLCKKYGWQLFDTSLEQMIDLDNPEKNGYAKYRSYVDMITKK
jgi:hypothetical protein